MVNALVQGSQLERLELPMTNALKPSKIDQVRDEMKAIVAQIARGSKDDGTKLWAAEIYLTHDAAIRKETAKSD